MKTSRSNASFWASIAFGALLVSVQAVSLYGPTGLLLGLGSGASLGLVIYYLGAMLSGGARWIAGRGPNFATSAPLKEHQMSNIDDKTRGTVNDGVGNLKQVVGNATGNEEMQAEGAAQETKGEAQKALGSVKEVVGDALKNAGNAIKGAGH